MLRRESLCLGQYPLYSQKALPLTSRRKWWGNWGYKRFMHRPTMTQAVGPHVNIMNVDREWMHYAMETGVRQWVMYRRVSWGASHDRAKADTIFYRSRRAKLLNRNFNAYMHFRIRKLLEEQANLSNKYGQAAVNQALGSELSDLKQSTEKKKWENIRFRIQKLPPSRPVTKHIITMRQIHNDRFNKIFRQY